MDLVEGWERRWSGKWTILLVFLRKRRRWAFSLFKQIRFRPGIHQPLRGFFGLIFPTKRIFEPTVLLLKKAARCHPFLAVVRCLFHNHLRLKRSSLLNVYLNYKFEISLLISHLFFSLFNLKIQQFLWVNFCAQNFSTRGGFRVCLGPKKFSLCN